MKKEIDISKEMEKAYSKNDMIWLYELFNEMYEHKTGERLDKMVKKNIKNLLVLNVSKPNTVSLEEIGKQLLGLIELYYSGKQ